MKTILSKNIKVITNAGGLNPLGLKAMIEQTCVSAGLPVPKVAAITGDDISGDIHQLKLTPFSINDETEALWDPHTKLASANAYIGARPIERALEQGAQVVITGRCVDSAIVLGPLMYEFGWKANEWNKLSSGSLAGHIIECGCQATGGNLTDWKKSFRSGWLQVGYPIAEVFNDGSFIISKPANTGGIVCRETISEQLVYEIHDPQNYILPDVVCDWTQVRLSELFSKEKTPLNQVRVEGALGKPPTAFYKVAATAFDGFKMDASLLIGGFHAREKAKAVAETIIERARVMLTAMKLDDFTHVSTDFLGSEASKSIPLQTTFNLTLNLFL